MSTADRSEWLPGLYHGLPDDAPDPDEDVAYSVGALSDATSHVELSDESGQNSHPESDEGDGHAADEGTSLDHADLPERFYDPDGETEEEAREHRAETNRQFANWNLNHAYYKRVSECRVPKPTYRRSELKEAFKSANLTLKKRWQECSASHADKIALAMEHRKRMEPHTKNDLLKNLERKMTFFEKQLLGLPLVPDVDTDAKWFAYIDDAESITKNLDAFMKWEWDNQGIEFMGF